ncbi:MAG: hypothetical protein M0025_05335 [Elusimicrobia bacterium]|nr:hypothetical protein [Elusimicrobiota bacterium]
MKHVLIYLSAVAAITIAVLLAAEQFFKANKKNQLPHIANNALSLSGGILAILVSGLTIFAFTGVLVPLIIFASMISAVVGAFYAWRLKRDRDTEQVWQALLDEEERQARETAEKDPANAAAWARLAQIKEKRGDLRAALELFSMTCKLEPTQLNRDKLDILREKVSALPPAPKSENTP